MGVCMCVCMCTHMCLLDFSLCEGGAQALCAGLSRGRGRLSGLGWKAENHAEGPGCARVRPPTNVVSSTPASPSCCSNVKPHLSEQR